MKEATGVDPRSANAVRGHSRFRATQTDTTLYSNRGWGVRIGVLESSPSPTPNSNPLPNFCPENKKNSAQRTVSVGSPKWRGSQGAFGRPWNAPPRPPPPFQCLKSERQPPSGAGVQGERPVGPLRTKASKTELNSALSESAVVR